MKPISLEARNFRSFAELSFDYGQGAVALVGPNGAGKSTLMSAVEVALFGARGRSLEALVRTGEDEMLIALTFEHSGETYRVRRECRRGKSSLDFDRAIGVANGAYKISDFEPLTQGNAADTQSLIESTIGLSRDTFRCSGYLAQRESDTFTGAQPRDRKQILGNALALHSWADAATRVGTDRLAARRTLDETSGRLEMLAEHVAQLPAALAERDRLSALLAKSGAAVTGAEAALDQAATAVRDAELAEASWKERKQAVQAAQAQVDAHSRVAIVADSAQIELTNARAQLEKLGTPWMVDALSDRAAELIDERTEYQNALTRREAAVQLVAERTRERDHHLKEALRYRLLGEALSEKAGQLAKGAHPRCDRCEQELPDEARERAIKSMLTEARAHAVTADEHAQAAKEIEWPDTPAVPTPPDDDEAGRVTAALAAAREVEGQRSTLTERIAGLERTIGQVDTPEYRAETERLNAAHQAAIDALNLTASPEPGALPLLQAAALQARAQLEQAGRVHAQTTVDHATAAARLKQLNDAEEQHKALTAQRADSEHRLDILTRLEQAFGRDGVPAWIVESQALPTVEIQANEVLQLVGGNVARIELRTEKATKTGEAREALDLIWIDPQGYEHDYTAASGGEKTRIEIAVAIGLSRLLDMQRGAGLRYLALDEPSGLDSRGTEALATVLRQLVAGGYLDTVLVSSHDAGLRDSFDQAVVLENVGGRSVVTA